MTTSEYGQIIKSCREGRGDTQGNFAAKMGVQRSTVANWEKGVMPPYLPDLVKYLSEAPPLVEPARNGHVSHDHTFQLSLPFDPPLSLELRIAPQRADTIQVTVQRKAG